MEPITAPPNPFVAETGSLVFPSFEDVFFLPGDWIIYFLSSRAAPVAETFGVGPADYGGTLAGSVSVVISTGKTYSWTGGSMEGTGTTTIASGGALTINAVRVSL